jgi:hypothetical protein
MIKPVKIPGLVDDPGRTEKPLVVRSLSSLTV